jgi:DNA-binding transcriptional regulator YdaS (Cro superfamily)
MRVTPIGRFKRAHGLTYPALAELLGLKPGYARKLGCGAVERVSPKLAEQIEKRSNGEISAVELVFPSSKPRRRVRSERHAGAGDAA